MHRARRLPIGILVAIALFAGPSMGAASSITSRILIDPVGENNADFFGTSVAWVGDVNGDGYDDLLIGAFRYPEIASLGQAYLYFGGPAIDSVADLVIPAPAGGTGWFGISVASAGDFNGDSYPDFIIGAQQSGYEGKAFIYYGGPSLDATPDLMLIGESTGSLTAFGASVASAGDMNEDGFDDVIVGAPQYASGGIQTGRTYVFFGGAVPNAVPDRLFSAVAQYDQLGSVVGSAGDMNGDGHPDLFASAPYADAAALNAGAIYVWFGGPAFDATPDLTLFGSSAGERLMNAANAGDVNADGFSDLIGAGKDHVYVWFGGSTPNPVPDLTLARTYATVAGAGDVNGDGIDDFLIGAPWDGTGGTVAGRVSVFFGGSTVDAVDDLHFVGDPGRNLGLCIAGGGHVDGSGPPDLIASGYEDPEAIGYNKGRVYVIANSPADTCPGQADGTVCNDSNPCTVGEVCGGGVCGGGTRVLPPAVNGSVSLVGDGSETTISWADPPGSYSVYRGTRSGSWVYNQTCHDSRIAASSATDTENPPINTMFFYLVTRVDFCGESIPGQDSGGRPNPTPAPCP